MRYVLRYRTVYVNWLWRSPQPLDDQCALCTALQDSLQQLTVAMPAFSGCPGRAIYCATGQSMAADRRNPQSLDVQDALCTGLRDSLCQLTLAKPSIYVNQGALCTALQESLQQLTGESRNFWFIMARCVLGYKIVYNN